MSKKEFLSRDGQYYETLSEAAMASLAWDKKIGLQKEQNRLIEQQNQLIMQQNENNNILARQKMQNEYEIEMEKLEIEKENNKQQLFNALSISKKTYDRYINKNYKYDTMDEIDQLNEKLGNYEYYSENTDERLKDIDSSEYTYDLYKECLTIPEYKVFSSNKEYHKFTMLLILNPFLVAIIVLFVIIMIEDGFIFSLFMSIIVLLIILVFSAKYVIPRLSYTKEEYLEQLIKTHAKFDKDKFIKMLNEEIKKCNEELNSLTEKLAKKISTSYSEFKVFRLSHYNKEIEQLLSDCGYREMIEDYGIEYQIVNSKNKFKDGTIEDYIVFFDEHI
ncbi:MAG: hypothetical protein ACI4U0_04930 [Candidatus Aphodocola sp.]